MPYLMEELNMLHKPRLLVTIVLIDPTEISLLIKITYGNW